MNKTNQPTCKFLFKQRQFNFDLLLAICIVFFLCASGSTVFAEEACQEDILTEIKGQVILPSNCVYHRSIQITEGNTALDCRGSTFIGNERENIGLLIDSQGRSMSNVTVKNCNFHNYASSGVRVTWNEIDANKGSDHEEIYKRTPTHINIENISVKDSGRVGIYLDDYVSDVIIKSSKISGSGGAGIYLEHSSRNIKLIGNNITGNGFGTPKLKANREGVAVDSSANNVIENNTFQGNSGGGVFLYKNCGEHINSGRQVIRWQHSDHNVIKDNFFVDEKVGVWLASRQRKNLTNMKCGDAPINEKGWYADFADFNSIEDNTFCRVTIPVNDYGKQNQIRGSKLYCQ